MSGRMLAGRKWSIMPQGRTGRNSPEQFGSGWLGRSLRRPRFLRIWGIRCASAPATQRQTVQLPNARVR
jgi:hypothetical protein